AEMLHVLGLVHRTVSPELAEILQIAKHQLTQRKEAHEDGSGNGAAHEARQGCRDAADNSGLLANEGRALAVRSSAISSAKVGIAHILQWSRSLPPSPGRRLQ